MSFSHCCCCTLVASSGQVAVDGNKLLPQTRGSLQGIRALSEGAKFHPLLVVILLFCYYTHLHSVTALSYILCYTVLCCELFALFLLFIYSLPRFFYYLLCL